LCLICHALALPGYPPHPTLKLQVVKDELADECDYSREASFIKLYGAPECLGEDARSKVPWVWPGSTERVLVMEHMEGVSIGDAVIGGLPQVKRHEVCKLLYLFQRSFGAT
jgi:predicted unusual protein kinase regulating ubiquinone biosynthesis (AarF/ABC1/UbiB family)